MRARDLVSKTILFTLFFIPLTVSSNQEEVEEGSLEEVVVTARKRAETSQSVPIPISVLSEDQLERRNITDIESIQNLTPNLDFESSSINNNMAQVYMRGIGQANWSIAQDPKIGIYIDGVYLSRPQGGLFDLMDVERVEVLRGPQGTLFGRNTTAGLIHLITKAPSQEKEGYIKAGTGNFGHQMIGAMFNTPFSDNVSARVAYYGKATDGHTLNQLTGNYHGDEDTASLRASIAGTGEVYSARITYEHFESQNASPLGHCKFYGPDDGMLAGGLGAVANIFGTYSSMKDNCNNTSPFNAIDNADTLNAFTDVDSLTLTQTIDISIGEITIISNERDISAYQGSWGWNMGNGPMNNGLPGNANLIDVLNNPSSIEVESHEIRLAGGSDNFDWVVGFYTFEENGDESIDVPLFRGVIPPSCTDWPFSCLDLGTGPLINNAIGAQLYGSRAQGYYTTNENEAVFAEATFQINDQLDLTLGVRRTEDDRLITRWQTLYDGSFDPTYLCPGMPTMDVGGTPVPLSDRCTQTISYSETTPRAILSYQMNDDVLVYGSYSVGYSSGGFNQDVRMRPYKPELSDNIELGFKSTLNEGTLRVNGTFFHNSYENQQLVVGRIVNGQPTADIINAQEATIMGIELEVTALLSESLLLNFAYGHIDGEYDKFLTQDNLYVTNADGTITETIVETDYSEIGFGNDGKEDSLSVSLVHTKYLDGGGELVSVLGAYRKDDQYGSLKNTPSSLIPSHTLFDGRLTLYMSDGKTSLSAWVKNLTDKEYVTTVLDQAGDVQIGGTDPSLGMTAYFMGQPRTAGLEIKRDF